jgi:uncharacterized protein YjiK
MRRSEIVLFAMFVAGVVLCLVPVRGMPPGPSRQSAAPARPAAATAPRSPAASEDRPARTEGIPLDGYDFDQSAAVRWRLPGRLKEISGLALTPDGRLLAHNDENGTVFEIDYRTGEVTKSFDLADSRGVVAGDFEGIAMAEDRVYLVTSDGRLYESPEGRNGDRVPCIVYDTQLGSDFEIEGLAYEPATRDLLLAAKAPRGKTAKDDLSIFRWSTGTKRVADGGPIPIPIEEIAARIKGKEFNATGVERHPLSGNYFLVAGPQHAIVEITPEGALVGVEELPGDRHPQVEGITFAADYRLIVSDEGSDKRSQLTLYPVLTR